MIKIETQQKSKEELFKEAEECLLVTQKFRKLSNGTYRGKYYDARITDKPGLTNSEFIETMGYRGPGLSEELVGIYNCLQIEYYLNDDKTPG